MKLARLLLSATVLVLSACNPLKDMQEMKDLTKHMDQTTSHLADVTEGMGKKTDHMAGVTDSMGLKTDRMANVTDHMSNVTDDMSKKTDQMNGKMDVSNANMARMIELSTSIYTDGRQSGAARDRRDAMAAMILAKTLADKVQDAALYFSAFEFQVWKGTGSDTDKKREGLEANAIDQFFRQARVFLKNYDDYSPISIADETKDLMALAAAMGDKNPNQFDAASAHNFKVISLEDILEQSLAMRPDIHSGNLKTWPPQVDSVLKNERAAVYLLNLRHNFLTTCAMAKLADIDVDSLLHSDQLMNLIKKGKLIKDRKPLDISYQNIPQMDEEILYFKESIRVRSVLLKMQYQVARSHMVAQGTEMITVQVDPNKLTGAVQAEKDMKMARAQTINKLLSRLNELKSPHEKVYNIIHDLGLNF